LASQRPSTVECNALSSYQVRQVAALLRSGEEVPMPRSALHRRNFSCGINMTSFDIHGVNIR